MPDIMTIKNIILGSFHNLCDGGGGGGGGVAVMILRGGESRFFSSRFL